MSTESTLGIFMPYLLLLHCCFKVHFFI